MHYSHWWFAEPRGWQPLTSTNADRFFAQSGLRRHDLVRSAASLAVADYCAVYSWPVLLGTVLPRVLSQVAFLAYVGETGAGAEGRLFALVGACVHVITVTTLVRGPIAFLEERPQGTLFRLRLGGSPLLTVATSRSWVFAVQAFAEAVLAVVVVVPLLGTPATLVSLLPALPLIALIALTTTILGAAVSAISLFIGNEVLLTNLASYVLMALAGVVFPLSELPIGIQWSARLLPLTNGLLAVRSVMSHTDWAGYALAEVAVAAAWLGVAALLFRAQDFHARRLGTDDSY